MTTMVRLTAVAALCGVRLAGRPQVSAGTTGYEVIDIGPPPETGGGVATSVNDDGIATVGGGGFGFVWSEGSLTTLNPLSGSSQSTAQCINNKGIAVGSSLGGPQRATQWKRGRAKALGKLSGYKSSAAEGVNGKGQIVGIVSKGTGDLVPVLWSGGKPRKLPVLAGATVSAAHGINDRSQIVGYSGTGTTFHAVLWEGRRLTDLGLLPGFPSTSALDINTTGSLIVGCALGNLTGKAVAWTNRALVPLPDFGGSFNCARATNSGGAIVGMARLPNGADRAVIWRNGEIQDLNTLLPPDSGWVLQDAYDVNESGWVVGYATHNEDVRGFLLRPTQ